MKELEKAEKELMESLKSSDANIVLDALQKVRESGNCRVLAPILQLLHDTDESNVEAKIVELLFDLRNQDCAPILIEALQDEELEHYHNFFIAAFWQSPIDGSEYLSEFIDAAIKGDYMVCLECLTVVENFDTTFSSQEILECDADLTEAIMEEQNMDKQTLLEELKVIINNLAIEAE